MKMAWDEKKANTEPETSPCTLGEMTGTFMSQTSLHGVQHVVNGERPKLARCLWLLTVLTMAGLLISTLLTLNARYQSNPHTTTINVQQSNYLPFPALTLCLKDPLDRIRLQKIPLHDLVEDFLYDQSSIDWENATVRTVFGNLTMQQVMDTGSFSLEEIAVSGERGVWPISLNFSQDFITKDYLLGTYPTRCYTYNAAERQPAGGLNFSQWDTLTVRLQLPQDNILPFYINGGIIVSVHDPWETDFFSGSRVAFGTGADVVMKPMEYRYLPAPYKSMGGEDCLDTDSPDFKSPLRHHSKYTFLNCAREYVTGATMSACNCTAVGDYGDYGLPECTLLQIYECYNEVVLRATFVPISTQTCLRPCRFRTLETKTTSVPHLSQRWHDYEKEKGRLEGINLTLRDMIKLTVKFEDTTLQVTEHVPGFTLDDVYSQLGGQMGLFVGASLLTVAELVEHVVFLLWTAIKRLCCKRTDKTAEDVK